jgi:class 3 adenylate cyclase/DNA-binding SARP family transcriptional activator
MEAASSPKFRLCLLGRFALNGPKGFVDLPNKKLAGLLTYLACTAPTPQHREKLATLLWGSHFEAQARQNFRQALFRLRRMLGHDVLLSTGDEVFLAPGSIDCDATRLEVLIGQGTREALVAAIELYKGRLLADVTLTEEAWIDWLDGERQRLEVMALDAMVKLGDMELQAGSPDRALGAADRAIAINSLREDAHRLVIRALAASGRRADALMHYENLVVLLKRELGVGPDATTSSLADELRKRPTAKAQPDIKSHVASQPKAAPDANVGSPEISDSHLPPGERKPVTALYADFRESLELLAQYDPENALKIFEAVLQIMTQAVHRYGGTVNSVMGDGIMALFGAPIAYEDHAVRACYAALQIQEAVERYAQGVDSLAGIAIRVRAGLNSGEVVVRPIAKGERTEYRVMGQTTHVATRLGQNTAPGTLLLSAETLRLAEGHVSVKASEAANIARAYKLVGAGAAQSRFQALATRGLTGFTGRRAEIAQLERTRAKAGRGDGQVVAIIGEPGLGKSRLVYEFVRSPRALGWVILETCCASYGTTMSYHPIVGLLRTYFEIEIHDHVMEVQNKVADRLLNLDRSLAPDLPAVLALLGIPVQDSSWQKLDALQRRQRTLDALKRLILRQCKEQPVIFICEDLHWADGETQAFLEALIDGLPLSQLLLVLTYRPEYEHRWHAKTYYRQLRLDDLSPEATKEFLDTLAGDDESLNSLKSMLPTRGTPLFLEETVRSLVEMGVLTGRRGAYRLVGRLRELPTPASVQAILAARIDRLPIRQKRLLQAASVIGKDVPHAILHPIADLDESELRHELAKLREAEFLYEARLFPQPEYAFKHPLTHEIAYGSLLVEDRAERHRQIVEVIERLYPDRLAEQIEQLAHHAVHGGLWEKAADYARQAANKAVTHWALQDARTWFEQALVALKKLPENKSTLELGFDIRFELRPVLVRLGEGRQQLECLQEAAAVAEKLNDDHRRGQVYTFMTNAHLLCGAPDEALVTSTRALQIAERLGDLRLRILTTTYLEQAHHHRG